MPGRAKKTEPATGDLFTEAPDLELPPPTPATLPPGFPESWAAKLAPEFAAPYFRDLTAFVEAERATHPVFPLEPDVFTAFRLTPPDQVRVVILGQDPYPTPGQGHGLAFSVRPGVVIPASLRNIYKELHDDLGVAAPRHGYLESWAGQGVLMLNAVLTVRAGAPNSHAGKGWERFTDAALAAVNGGPPAVFLLWGSYAQKKAKLIDAGKHVLLKSVHPSPLSASNGFFGSKPFSKINAALESLGREPIDWRLPAEAAESPVH